MAKKGRFGKRQLPIIENIPYCKILYAINKDKLQPFEISKITGQDNSLIIKHLKILIKEGFIDVDKVKKTKVYSVNFNKITKEFIDFLKKKGEDNEEYFKVWQKNSVTSKGEAGNKLINRYLKGELPHQTFDKAIEYERWINNPFLIDYFKKLFSSLSNQIKSYKDLSEKPIIILFEYIMKNNVVDFYSLLHIIFNKEPKDDSDKVILSSFYPVIKKNNYVDYYKNEDEYIKNLKEDIKSKKFGLKKEIELLKRIDNTIFTAEEKRYMWDYAIRLPIICNNLSTNMFYESALKSTFGEIPKSIEQGEILNELFPNRTDYKVI